MSPVPPKPPTLTQTAPLRGLEGRLTALRHLLGKLVPVPAAWLTKAAGGDKTTPGPLCQGCLPCTTYAELVTSWRKALKWTEGLDHALAVMLASVTSTKTLGDQLWVKLIGPAACGKSTLCEALSINKDYVIAKSTIRGFHSGYKSDKGEDGEDNSLIPLIRDKTLVTKDGDTLLQSPNLGQILSEGRDLYDSVSRSHYRNRMGKDYMGIRMTWLLAGTSALRAIDSSELGERFLDCVIMHNIDDELENEILWRVANRADRNLAMETDGKLETQYEPELAEAMQLTGGYVAHLRENATDVLSTIDNPAEAMRYCTRLGKFVAYMRARPSKQQEEQAERELAARLVSQHVRLAKCLAVVLNRKSVDGEVMRRVRQVSLDTGRGQTLNIAKLLYGVGEKGSEPRAIALRTNQTEDKTRGMLRFLREIGIVTPMAVQGKGLGSKVRWRLTNRLQALYEEVVEDAEG